MLKAAVLRKVVFSILALAILAGIALAYIVLIWAPRTWDAIAAQAMDLSGEDPVCLFEGYYSPSGVPVARLRGADEPLFYPRADLADHLNSEGAKPFHFGILILREDPAALHGFEADIFGWSYREAAFWHDRTGVFRNANYGDWIADCRTVLGLGS